jgi:hypothetical protein
VRFARVSGFSFVLSFKPRRTTQCGAVPERVGLNQHVQGRLRCVIGLGCLPTPLTALAQPLRTDFDSAPVFWLADLTLLAGDLCRVLKIIREALIRSGCWFKPT